MGPCVGDRHTPGHWLLLSVYYRPLVNECVLLRVNVLGQGLVEPGTRTLPHLGEGKKENWKKLNYNIFGENMYYCSSGGFNTERNLI